MQRAILLYVEFNHISLILRRYIQALQRARSIAEINESLEIYAATETNEDWQNFPRTWKDLESFVSPVC